ncbi:hypothetical protein J7J84_00715 [bacterium]|nr:hypothetical protein [bacterium]
MLLDREDARKLADLIGKKMAQDPEKWRTVARKVGPKSGCSSLFGPGDNLPAPGEAAHALNFMHHAVRGVRPYPENGGGAGRAGDRNCGEYGDNCIESGGFNPSSCTTSVGFNGDEYCQSPGGGYTGPCIAPDIYMCAPEKIFECSPPFKCNAPFDCEDSFGGCDASHKYCQCADLQCMNDQVNYNCSNFTCSAKNGSEFGCHPEGVFTCGSTGSVFGCAVIHTCQEGPFNCVAGQYHCTNTFECQTDDYYDCNNEFTCHNAGVTCYERFDCSSSFECDPRIGFKNESCDGEEYDCWNDFNCEEEAYSPE